MRPMTSTASTSNPATSLRCSTRPRVDTTSSTRCCPVDRTAGGAGHPADASNFGREGPSSTSPPAPVSRRSNWLGPGPRPITGISRSACCGRASTRRPGTCLRRRRTRALPFADGVFDAVTISFGLRNVEDPHAALTEMFRVTRPGGRLVVCGFAGRRWRTFRRVYIDYLSGPAGDRRPRLVQPAGLRLPRPSPSAPGRTRPSSPDGSRAGWRDVRLPQPHRRHRRPAPCDPLSQSADSRCSAVGIPPQGSCTAR